MTSIANQDTQSSNSSDNKEVDKIISFKSEQEVKEYCEQHPDLKWIVYDGEVYDVNDYLPLHPGGSDMIDVYIGKPIDEPFEDQGHSRAAKRLFKSFPHVGTLKGTVK